METGMLQAGRKSNIELIFVVLRVAIHHLQGMISFLLTARGAFYFFLGVIFWGIVWSYPLLLEWIDRPIASVHVGGRMVYLDKKQIKNRLMPLVKESFFSLNVESVQDRLLGSSWVERVSVRKVWPDKLKIEIFEKQIVARWLDQALISSHGEVFYPDELGDADNKLISKLPELFGPSGTEGKVMRQYMIFSHYLRPASLKLSEVGQTSSGRWMLKIGSVKLLVGNKTELERISRFNSLYHRRLKDRWQYIKQVDLRYRDGVAVTWKQSDVIE